MAIKKSELYSSLWEGCNKLRWSMDASQYKDYVLVILFMKYVTDKYFGKEDILYIPEGWSFHDMVNAKWKSDIWDRINKIIKKFAEENDLVGTIDKTDFADDDKLGKWKEMVDRLTDLIAIFENKWLDFSSNKAEWDDIIWDAYEYLMRHFATESWKSKWQFYTPAEVSRIMAKIIGIDNSTSKSQTVYDPTCWSGSLLLKAADEAPNGLSIYWQEMDNQTWALAKMNMILHGNPEAEIEKWNSSLSKPLFKDNIGWIKTFDYIVANPPFSDKNWMSGFNPLDDEFLRFEHGIPPKKNGDYAFLLHIIKSLKSTGKWAVILPHGVLFRWNAEWTIRERIIRKWYLKWIIWLPANLFYGTWIPACILIIDKEEADTRKEIFMIDASKWFMKDGNKNRLRYQDLHKIVDTFNNKIKEDKYSRYVSYEEIEKNEYNLNIPRYIDTSEEEDIQSIEAHLNGWIPNADIEKLSEYFSVCPNLKNELFEEDRPGYSKLKVSSEDIQSFIYSHKEFVAYKESIESVYKSWHDKTSTKFQSIKAWIKPKEIIHDISEDLLNTFNDDNLIDKYDMYQHLMDYWNEVMQDDMYMIGIDWWIANTYRILEKNTKWKEVDKGWTCDLLPKEIIINEFFKEESEELVDMRNQLEEADNQINELVEEQTWDNGLLLEVINEKGKITKALITARLKVIKWDSDFDDEREMFDNYLSVVDKQSVLKKEIKKAEEELDKNALLKYPELTEQEIKDLVIEKKWLLYMDLTVHMALHNISQDFTWLVKELNNRYEDTLSNLTDKTKELEGKLEEHLKMMWFNI